MWKVRRPWVLRRGAVVLVALLSLGLGASPAAGYAPVDELIGLTNQLYQAGEIADVTVMANLVVSLQNIAALADSGDRTTAAQLLDSFIQEVSSLSGSLLSAGGATQLVEAARRAAAGL